jgi:uncharacterized membrane protein YheB (UPF0754 family)
MADDPTFKIPRDVIQPIIEAKVSAALIEALGNQDWLVKNCIAKVLDEKVNDNGTKCDNYYRDNAPTFLQWALRSCVQASIKRILEEQIALHKEEITKALKSELERKNSPLVKQLIQGMTTAFTNSNTLKYHIDVKAGD